MAQPALQQLLRIQMAYPRLTGRTEDTQTNTIYVGTDTLSRSALLAVVDPLIGDFVHGIDSLLDDDMFTTQMLVTYWDMLDPEPRVPFSTQTWSLVMAVGQTLPAECTMALSFAGAAASGEPQARRRGRIFLPTFQTAAIEENAAGDVVWTAAAIGAVRTAAEALKAGLLAGAAAWTVFSPTTFNQTAGSTLAKLQAASTYIAGGWIDNEPDTQRRRGGGSRTKTNWT